MNEDDIIAAMYAIGFGLLMLFFVNLAIDSQDCSRKGGEMMRSFSGGYVCVKPVK